VKHRNDRLARWFAGALAAAALLSGAGTARAQFDQGARQQPPPPAPAAPKLTKEPKLLKSVEPVYPPEALSEQLSAEVTLMVDLDAQGHVTKVDVPKPVGHGFDEAARAAVLQYEFSPAEVDNKPSPIRFQFTLHFLPKVVPETPPEAADGGAPDAAAPPPPPPPPAPPPVVVARGRLREKGTRNPLREAEVSVIARPEGAPEAPAELVGVTDEDGRFEVKAQPGVAMRVIIADPGHEPCIRDLAAPAVSADKPAELECLVPKRLGTLYETTSRAAPPTQAPTRYTLAKTELQTVPGTFGDPLRVVQNLPGVARTPFGLGLLVIRGAPPNDSGIYVEGHRIPILYHFLGGPSVLTPRLINNIEFYPGNFGVKYGRATAGIVDVGITMDATPRLHGQADINFIDSSAYVEGPLGHGWSGSVSARRSYFDILLPLVVPSSTTTAAPVYYDYQAGVHRDLANGRLALFAFGSNDSLEVISKSASVGNLSLDTSTGFHKVFGIWSTTNHGWVNRLSPSYGYQKLTFGAGQVGINQSQHELALRDELSRPLGTHVLFRAGIDLDKTFDELFVNVQLAENTRLYGDRPPDIIPTTIPLDTLGLAAYTDATIEPGGGLTMTPGVRVDYFRYVGQDRVTFDPRLTLRWKATARLALKGGVGIYHRMQEPQLLDPKYGTPTLPPIWADQYSAGFVSFFTDKLSLDTTFYFVRRHDEPVPATPGFTASGKGRSYGMELILKHEFTERFFGWIAYTLARSEQSADSVNGVGGGNGMGTLQMPGATQAAWYPTAFDQTHNLNVVGSYVWRAWRFGTRFRYVTGSPSTPLYEGTYDADKGTYVCREGPLNSTRQPTFNQLDFRIDRTWTFNAWQLGAYLDIQNIYNAANPEFTVPDYRCRGSVPVRGIPFLPILGVKGMF
jgi:TonB family protein